MFSGSSSVLMDVVMVTDPEVVLSNHLSPRVSVNYVDENCKRGSFTVQNFCRFYGF